jgi:hypothetical protein
VNKIRANRRNWTGDRFSNELGQAGVERRPVLGIGLTFGSRVFHVGRGSGRGALHGRRLPDGALPGNRTETYSSTWQSGIHKTDVDPSVRDGTPAALSRSYAVAALQLFNSTLVPGPSGAYNAELVKQLSPEMQEKLRHYGTPITG